MFENIIFTILNKFELESKFEYYFELNFEIELAQNITLARSQHNIKF